MGNTSWLTLGVVVLEHGFLQSILAVGRDILRLVTDDEVYLRTTECKIVHTALILDSY